MPAITATPLSAIGRNTLTVVTLDGSTDSLVYDSTKKQVLLLNNVTAGALTPAIVGSTASSAYSVSGIGAIDLHLGYQVGSMAAGAQVAIPLNTIANWLSGIISITGGTGIEAALLEY